MGRYLTKTSILLIKKNNLHSFQSQKSVTALSPYYDMPLQTSRCFSFQERAIYSINFCNAASRIFTLFCMLIMLASTTLSLQSVNGQRSQVSPTISSGIVGSFKNLMNDLDLLSILNPIAIADSPSFASDNGRAILRSRNLAPLFTN